VQIQNKKENQLLNVAVNIIVPFIILTKLSDEEYLGPIYGLVLALLFPLIFGLYSFVFLKQKSITSIIGFIGVALTGTIGLLRFPPHWIAVKEAAIPLIIGLIVLFSTKTSWQVITKFLFNSEIFDIDKIHNKLDSEKLQTQLSKVLARANIFLSFSFFISALLNYFLAKIIVQSMPGTTQFNEEIGRMTMLSFPVIVLPSILITICIFWYIMSSIKNLTQLNTNEILSEKLQNNNK
jgi:hypothetical protein